MGGELNEQFKKDAIKEFDADDIRTLIKGLKNKESSEDIKDLVEKLDNKDTKESDEQLSSTENILLQNLENTSNIISFLEGISRQIETNEDNGVEEDIVEDYIKFINNDLSALKLLGIEHSHLEERLKTFNYNYSKNHLSKEIQTEAEKLYSDANDLKANYFKDKSLDIDENISESDLKSKFKNSTEEESLIILRSIKSNSPNFPDIFEKYGEKKLANIYLDALVEKGSYKEITGLVDGGKLLTIGVCASPEKVYEVRNKIFQNQKEKLIKNAENQFGKTLGKKFITELTQKIEQNKKSSKASEYCSINMINFVKTFEEKNIDELNKEKGEYKELTKNAIREITNNILKTEETKSKKNIAEVAKILGVQEQDLNKKKIEEAKDKGLINEEDANKFLDAEKSISKIRKSKNFFNSLTTKEFDTILKNPEKDPLEIKEEIIKGRKIKDDINQIYSRPIVDISYSIQNISTIEKKITIEGESISLTDEEYKEIGFDKDSDGKDIIQNPEALKNLVDMKTYLEKYNMGFAWENREVFLQSIIQRGGTNNKINFKNSIDKTELNYYLNGVLEIIGVEGGDLLYKTTAKILEVSGGSLNVDKTDINTELGVIGTQFYEKGFISENGIINFNNQSKIINFTKETDVI